jgi:hypothetical protein
MAIAIDDRVVELGFDFRWALVGVTAHGFLRKGLGRKQLDASLR